MILCMDLNSEPIKEKTELLKPDFPFSLDKHEASSTSFLVASVGAMKAIFVSDEAAEEWRKEVMEGSSEC